MLERLRNEPVLITAVVAAVLNLIVAFGVDIDEQSKLAILALVDSLLAIWVRQKVTPVRKAN